jgi:tRNA 2-thiouridine synthesizing protein B
MNKTILHTVNQSPFSHQALNNCIHVYTEGDAILLLENGVYACLLSQPLIEALSNKKVFALSDDIEARGLDSCQISNQIEIISFKKFVELTIEHDMVQSWY